MEYRPYVWLGEDHDRHVQDFRKLEELEMLRNAQGGGVQRLRDMAALQLAMQNRPVSAIQMAQLQNSMPGELVPLPGIRRNQSIQDYLFGGRII